MSSKLKALVNKINELEKKLAKEGRDVLKETFKEFFSTHPMALSIVWSQYTPYFNDGDACTFSVNDFELKLHEPIKGLIEVVASEDEEYNSGDACASSILRGIEDCDNNRGRYNSANLRKLTAEEKAMCDDYDDLYISCSQIARVMQMTFGDHVEITATKEGFNVEDYDHD